MTPLLLLAAWALLVGLVCAGVVARRKGRT